MSIRCALGLHDWKILQSKSKEEWYTHWSEGDDTDWEYRGGIPKQYQIKQCKRCGENRDEVTPLNIQWYREIGQHEARRKTLEASARADAACDALARLLDG